MRLDSAPAPIYIILTFTHKQCTRVHFHTKQQTYNENAVVVDVVIFFCCFSLHLIIHVLVRFGLGLGLWDTGMLSKVDGALRMCTCVGVCCFWYFCVIFSMGSFAFQCLHFWSPSQRVIEFNLLYLIRRKKSFSRCIEI